MEKSIDTPTGNKEAGNQLISNYNGYYVSDFDKNHLIYYAYKQLFNKD